MPPRGRSRIIRKTLSTLSEKVHRSPNLLHHLRPHVPSLYLFFDDNEQAFAVAPVFLESTDSPLLVRIRPVGNVRTFVFYHPQPPVIKLCHEIGIERFGGS